MEAGTPTAPRRPREWSALVAALRDPARSDFAFVPHRYVEPQGDWLLASPSETTPINGATAKRGEHGRAGAWRWLGAQSSAIFWLHVAALGLTGCCAVWLSLFPIAPNRLYNMQVDVFNSNHAHAEFFYHPCVYLGAVLGAALAGYLGNRLGRAGTLELAAVPYVLGWLLHAIALGEVTLLLGRYLLGASIGMMAVVTPIYVAEISAARSRGRLVCMLALVAAIGQLCYLAIGLLFVHLSREYVGFNLSEWKVLAMVGVAPGVALLLLMQRLPDSPTWLVARHDDREAAFAVVLELFDGDYARAEREVNGLIHASVVAQETHAHHGAFFRPLWLCVALFVLRAVTAALVQPSLGSAAASSFSVSVFGVGLLVGDTEQLAILAVLLLAACVGTAACFVIVDLRGRVMALQSGCTLVVLGCLLILFTDSSSVKVTDQGSAALLLITAGHQLGLAIGPVVLLGELFPMKRRVAAASLVVMAEAFTRLALAYALPLLRQSLSFTHTFMACVALVLVANAAGVGIAWFYLPETSNRSLQSIEAILSGWYPETPQLAQSRVRLAHSGNDDHENEGDALTPRHHYGTA